MSLIPALGPRRVDPEILDGLPPDAARASLADLVRLNRDFGGHAVLRKLLARVLPADGIGAAESFSVLDIGGASGDMAGQIRAGYPGARITVLDHVAAHMETALLPKVCGDAFALPFRDRSFDYAFSSLFLHHFEDRDVVKLFAEMARVSRRGVLAIDLIRSPLAYWFFDATGWLFGWDPVTKNDGPISFAAGFHRAELARLAAEAGLETVRVTSHRPAWRHAVDARVAIRP
ncbi:MAG: methyltransferase domain-containing protein [Bryobacteraceae bacterium]